MLRCDRRIDLDEYIHGRINQSITTDCSKLWPCRPLPTAHKTDDTAV